jgi:deoxyribodipyrimidine photo-lyase
MQKKQKGIWFRNDLRVHDNESLFNAVENNESVIAVF